MAVQFRLRASMTEVRRLAGAPDLVPLVEVLNRAADGSLQAWIRWWWTRATAASDPPTDPPAKLL